MNLRNVGIFIPVRLSSKRLSGKSMRETILGYPIEILIKNLLDLKINSKNIIICTSREIIDKKLKLVANKYSCNFFAGSKSDIIERFYRANQKFKFKYIFEIDGDDIMTDVSYLIKCLSILIKKNLDFIYTKNLPLGLNCKVFTANALKDIFNTHISKNNANGFMYFFYRNSNLKKLCLDFKDYKNIKLRLTLDYLEDLKFIEILSLILKRKKLKYSLKNYIKIIRDNQDLANINYFKNFEWQKNTNSMKPLKIEINGKVKRIFIN
ncbi:hypothetical protein OAT43_02480 [Candidatus Pelagibacter ubique]|nr:hypothetical protein [Candidatus Pelagibacter ubique]